MAPGLVCPFKSFLILLLFVFHSPDYMGTCLVFTAPSISPPSYFGPDQCSLSTRWEWGTKKTCWDGGCLGFSSQLGLSGISRRPTSSRHRCFWHQDVPLGKLELRKAAPSLQPIAQPGARLSPSPPGRSKAEHPDAGGRRGRSALGGQVPSRETLLPSGLAGPQPVPAPGE